MCKRFIAIPLLCLVAIMAACPFSVYADSFPYPENNVSGSYTVYYGSQNATGIMCSGAETLNFGQLWTGKFLSLSDADDPSGDHGSMGYGLALAADITLSITVGGDLFLALPYHLDETNLISGSLSAYRSESGDYNVDFGDDWSVKTYTPVPDSNSFVSGSGIGSVYIRFLCYRNVPAGDYSLSYVFSDNFSPICFGVYASLGNQMNAMVDQFVNQIPSSSPVPSDVLSAFLKELWDYRQSLNSESVEESMLHELEYQSSLEYLLSQVDVKYISFLKFFSQETNGMLSALASGGIDYSAFISNVMGATSNASALCSTTEQYQCLINLSQNALAIAEGIEQQKVKAHLDQAISDEDMQKADEFHALESQLVQAFDHAELEAALQFDIWINQLPLEEVYEYRKFFDYLLTDSDIRYFIVVPLAMSLVALLLGTRMRTKPDDSDSGSGSWHTPHVSRLDREYYRTFHDYQK